MAEPGEHPEVFGADEQQAVAIDVLRWTGLARFVLIAERAPAGGELSLIFVDEEAITELNERFLAGTGATDVLAFPLEDDPPLGGRQPDQGGRGPGSPAAPSDPPVVIGDVVVCPSVVERNALDDGNPLDDELGRVVVHGVLHLLDYDHGDDHAASTMSRREDELLASWRSPAEGKQ